MTTATRNAVTALFTLICLVTFAPSLHAAQTSIGKITLPLSRTVSGDYTLSLNISGQTLHFVMTESSVVSGDTKMVNLDGYPQQSSFQSFQGRIRGEENSWIRLGVHGESLSGVISKQGNRYQLAGSTRGLVTLKLLSEQSSHNLNSHATQLRQPRSLTSTAETTAVSHVVDMAIAVDSQYNALHNGNGLEKALSIINSVDGIYREEFGIALRVVSALIVTNSNNDPFNFGNVTIETMLRGLRDYRMQTTQFNDASLVHLFTGNQNSDAPVGLAWINTACRTDGYDVGLSTPYRHEILLAAHEIAHNLGAMHDTDTACNIEDDKVMWPYISNQTSQNFSACTRSSVRRSLQNSCHVATVDLQVSLFADDENTYTATVRNNDSAQSSTSSTLIIDLPANTIATALDGDCSAPDEKMECAIGTLLPGGENHVRLSVENFDGKTSQQLVASIDSNDQPDLSSGNNTATVYKGDATFNDYSDTDEPDLIHADLNLVYLNVDGSITDKKTGGNGGEVYEQGVGSVAQFIVVLGLVPLVTRRRKRRSIR